MHYRAIARFAQIVYIIDMTISQFMTFLVERPGVKYTRIVQTATAHRSVYCFVDAEGNIYKSAGWKAPAKGVRSTLATVDIANVDPYGSWLYRRAS
jgi:hypothetical protein